MIVYLAQDIPAFVMYCVNGESGSSLLIESTDSMMNNHVHRALLHDRKEKRETEREKPCVYIFFNNE